MTETKPLPTPSDGPSSLGLVTIAAALMTLAGLFLFALAGLGIMLWKPDLSTDSFLLILVGAGVLGLTFVSGMGFLIGLADMIQSDRSGNLWALVVNGGVAAFMVALFAIALLRS